MCVELVGQCASGREGGDGVKAAGEKESKAKDGGDQNMIIVTTSKLPTTMHRFHGRLKHHQKKKKQHQQQQQHSTHARINNWKQLPLIIQLASSSSYWLHEAQKVLISCSNHNLPRLYSNEASVGGLCSAESVLCRELQFLPRTDIIQIARKRIMTLSK